MISLKKLLIDTAGLENYTGTEEYQAFTFGGPRTSVAVAAPGGDPEFVAAFNEAVFRALPLSVDKFNACMAAYMHSLHLLAQSPANWKRYRRAADIHALERLAQ